MWTGRSKPPAEGLDTSGSRLNPIACGSGRGSGGIEDGRKEIESGDQVGDPEASIAPVRKAQDQRHSGHLFVVLIVEQQAVLEELFTVVRGQHDQGPLGDPEVLEGCQQKADLVIDV